MNPIIKGGWRLLPKDFGPYSSLANLFKLAIREGYNGLLKLILRKGMRILSAESALTHAAHYENEKALEILLDYGLDLDMCEIRSYQPLLVEVDQKHIGIARTLLKRNAAVNLGPYTASRKTALLLAVRNEDEAMVRLLLEYGAHVIVENEKWLSIPSAFHLAAARGSLGMLKILLETGADVNIREWGGGWTPLHIAIKNSWLEAAKLLIANGADLDLLDKGKTPLLCLGQRHDSYAYREDIEGRILPEYYL